MKKLKTTPTKIVCEMTWEDANTIKNALNYHIAQNNKIIKACNAHNLQEVVETIAQMNERIKALLDEMEGDCQ